MGFNKSAAVELVAQALAGTRTQDRRRIAEQVGVQPETIRKYAARELKSIPPERWSALEQALGMPAGVIAQAVGAPALQVTGSDLPDRLEQLAETARLLSEEVDALRGLVAGLERADRSPR